MEIYRKNLHIQSEAEAVALLDEMDDFVKNPVIGKPQPILDPALMKIWNDGEHLEWEWSDESELKYNQRTAKEKAEADLLAFYQDPANLEAWKDAKVRPWRNQKLAEWIDDTFIKPLKYNLTGDQVEERAALRIELLDWPGTFTEWVDDEAIDAAKLTAPSWISE